MLIYFYIAVFSLYMSFFCSACFLIRIVFVKLLKDIVTNTAWSKYYKKQYKYKTN